MSFPPPCRSTRIRNKTFRSNVRSRTRSSRFRRAQFTTSDIYSYGSSRYYTYVNRHLSHTHSVEYKLSCSYINASTRFHSYNRISAFWISHSPTGPLSYAHIGAPEHTSFSRPVQPIQSPRYASIDVSTGVSPSNPYDPSAKPSPQIWRTPL